MNPTITVDTVLNQAEHLSFDEKLLLLEQLASSVRVELRETPPIPKNPRVLGLREGQMWMADEFGG